MNLWERARAAFQPRRLRADYQRVFGGPPGRRVLGHIIDGCELTRSKIRYDHQGRVDTESMLIAEGRRQVGLMIMQMLHLSEDDLREMERTNAGDGGNYE